MPNANSPTINLLNDQQWIIVAIDYRAGLSLVNEEEDCRYGVRFAKSLPKVDRARVGVMGGSHGGQHAMRMAETMGTEILCAVIGSPFMTDPQTFLYGSPDEYPIALLSAEAFDTLMEQRKSALPGFNRMSPAARDKLFAEHSCERNTKAVEVPLLLLTSRADMNVNHLMVEGTINNLLADGKNVVNFISEVCFHGFYWGRVESPNFPDKTPAQLADEATARGYELGFFEYWFAAAHALPR
jgi:dienelactone hydrolase